ncbi:MAG: PTS sugar transporter subunit IIA [Ignavibacteriales bacterium]|nr:PTS sugar transporter subunit IIA [Ignavibacteriales bacterium]MBK7378060.1 PTS sugar transporter subunit IIA [Ignavibacteriales bacterium]
MKVTDILTENFIIAELQSNQKNEAINELLELFRSDDRVLDFEKMKESVLEREKIMSTGVGKGFAIPHGKTSGVKEILAAFGKSTKPIEYDSLDGKPVQLLFLLIGRENMVSAHIKLLSRISRMMNRDEFRQKLIDAKSSAEILDYFRQEEINYFDV